MSNEISSSDLVELIRGQARLEQKIDNFFQAQGWMRHELDVVKNDVSAVRADVAELKVQKRLSGSYLRGVMYAATIVATVVSFTFSQFLEPLLKKFLGI
jgi:hypothetical protein